MNHPSSFHIDTWLAELGLEDLVPIFRVNHITLDTLKDLTNDDLKDCGVTAVGHRKKILAAIEKLKALPTEEASHSPEAKAPTTPQGVPLPVEITPAAQVESAVPMSPEPAPAPPAECFPPVAASVLEEAPSPTVAPSPRSKPTAPQKKSSSGKSLALATTIPHAITTAPATAGQALSQELHQRQDAQQAALQRQQRLSFITSTIIAILSLALMMIILAFFVLPAILQEAPQVVVYENATSPTDTVEVKKINTQMQRKPSSPSSSVAKVIAANTSSPTAVPVPDVAVSTPSLDFGDSDDFGDGWGDGDGTGSGAGGGTTFFGMKKATKAIVYVFDISGSMIVSPKSVKTYEVLETEIINSITMLGNDARFGLVGFSKGADSYKSNLVSATTFEQRDATQWLKRMSPVPASKEKFDFKNYKNGRHSGTRADLGIEMAMRMKPDTIIFVSDGEPTDAKGKSSRPYEQSILKLVEEMQQKQTTRVQINCVAYMAGGGMGFMRDLAKRNNGEFREIRPGKGK